MKKVLFCLLIVWLLLLLNDSAAQEHQLLEVPRISAELALLKHKAGTVVLIDAMPNITYAKYHILGAINLPNDGEADRERIRRTKLPIPLNREIIVYCD
jgi:rhodanese-related sulfurtransferase